MNAQLKPTRMSNIRANEFHRFHANRRPLGDSLFRDRSEKFRAGVPENERSRQGFFPRTI